MDPRRRHQHGEAVEQLQRAVPARTGLDARVEQALGIEFAPSVQGQRRAGAIAQQPLTSGTVSGRDAHRRIDGEAAAVLPLRHRQCVIGRQQAAPHEQARAKRRRTCAWTSARAVASSPG